MFLILPARLTAALVGHGLLGALVFTPLLFIGLLIAGIAITYLWPLLLIGALVLYIRRLQKEQLIINNVDAAVAEAEAAAAAACRKLAAAQYSARSARDEPDKASEHAEAARSALLAVREAAINAENAAGRARTLALPGRSASIRLRAARATDAVSTARVCVREAKQAVREARVAMGEAVWAHAMAQIAERHAAMKNVAVAPVRALFQMFRSTVDGVRRKHGGFSEAAMATCAMIAAADRLVTEAEKQRVQTLIESNGVLSSLDSRRLSRMFASYCEKLLEAPENGRIEVQRTIADANLGQTEARSIVQLALLVAAVHNTASATADARARELCDMIGLYSKEAHLGTGPISAEA